MRRIAVDNCSYCACKTYLSVPDDYLDNIEALIENEEIGCDNCLDDGDYHTEFDVYEADKKVWCGHSKKCKNLDREE